jgi:hypothetical protein
VFLGLLQARTARTTTTLLVYGEVLRSTLKNPGRAKTTANEPKNGSDREARRGNQGPLYRGVVRMLPGGNGGAGAPRRDGVRTIFWPACLRDK